MIWTKKFDNHTDYDNYINGSQGKVYKPNVSFCKEEYEAHYNNGGIDKPNRTDYGPLTVGNMVDFKYKGGSQTVSLTTASDNKWTLTQKSDWLDVSPRKGIGSTELTVTADEYDGESKDRKGSFTTMLLMSDAKPTYTETEVTQDRNYNSSYLIFEITSDGVIRWKVLYTAYTTTIQYSKNGGAWTSITSATGNSAPSISVVSGDTVQFRGDNATYSSGETYYNTFSGTTCGFKVKGNIMSLINSTDFSGNTTLQSGYTFCRLFLHCSGLTDASNLVLPATTLADGCYCSMFEGCSGLTSAPELPATTLAAGCYREMFDCCSRLTTPPELPATTLANNCYQGMFDECTGLLTAPELPATTLASNCYYYMFGNCYSLTTPPKLPATTLVDGCYKYMFSNCIRLRYIPYNYLPATTLVNECYYGMFWACKSLTSAPALPATTLATECYSYMFANCTGLTTAPQLLVTNLSGANYCYESMFAGCTSLTTAPSLPATTLSQYCYQYMFSGCTSLRNVPSTLPATKLTPNCYYFMFSNCRNLTTMPTLPATTMSFLSYGGMFADCTSLTSIPSNYLPATTLYDNCYCYMFRNCTGLTSAPLSIGNSSMRMTASACTHMFQGCTSLTTAPTLPITALTYGCYGYMFSGCTNLTTAPELPATTLSASCYYGMFYGCSNLEYIKCMATDLPNNCTNNWMYGVQTSSGTFVKNPSMNNWTRGTSGIPDNWTVEDAT